jgi:hypothetical protein
VFLGSLWLPCTIAPRSSQITALRTCRRSKAKGLYAKTLIAVLEPGAEKEQTRKENDRPLEDQPGFLILVLLRWWRGSAEYIIGRGFDVTLPFHWTRRKKRDGRLGGAPRHGSRKKGRLATARIKNTGALFRAVVYSMFLSEVGGREGGSSAMRRKPV